jgi:hypothetical protein
VGGWGYIRGPWVWCRDSTPHHTTPRRSIARSARYVLLPPPPPPRAASAQYPRACVRAGFPASSHPFIQCDAVQEVTSHRSSTRPSRGTRARCPRYPTLMAAQLLLSSGRDVLRLWIPSAYASTRSTWSRPNGIVGGASVAGLPVARPDEGPAAPLCACLLVA